MLFKKVIEMRHFRKAQRIRNFRYVPGAVPQHDFCLLQNPLADDLSRCFVGDCFYRPVQVIDVDVQLLRKTGGCPEAHFRVVFVDGKLAFEQFQKQGGDALRSVYLLFIRWFSRLHFHGKM